MAVVHFRKRDGTLEELGRTEVIMDTENSYHVPLWDCADTDVGFCSSCLFDLWIYGSLLCSISPWRTFPYLLIFSFHVYDIDTKYHNLPVKVQLLAVSSIFSTVQLKDTEKYTSTLAFIWLSLFPFPSFFVRGWERRAGIRNGWIIKPLIPITWVLP